LTLSPSSFNDGHEHVDFKAEVGGYYLQSPAQAFAKIATLNIDVASVTAHLKTIIAKQLPDNVAGLTLTLRPEIVSGDSYHYTHGLKLHDGNCQRIAHGHRSTIQIFKNDQRCTELEKSWCQRWKDIYIASEADRINKEDIQLSDNALINTTPGHHFFSYHAPQGRFDIAVPENVLDVVDCDSTVELLADFIARQLSKASPSDNFKVIAYEGVGKGAIAHA